VKEGEGGGDAGRSSVLASLGLGPRADEGDIRRAYRRLALRFHPDASGDPRTARRFARVVRAYKILVAGTGEPRRRVYGRVEEAGSDLFTLGQLLASEPEPSSRSDAARELGLSGKSAAYVFLRRAFYDPSEEVALEAVRAVALLGSRQAEGEVAALYTRSNARQKARILEIALATGERLFRSTIQAATTDPDPLLRAMASRSAATKEP
jgi:curved DNA-binding protein CbpA